MHDAQSPTKATRVSSATTRPFPGDRLDTVLRANPFCLAATNKRENPTSSNAWVVFCSQSCQGISEAMEMER